MEVSRRDQQLGLHRIWQHPVGGDFGDNDVCFINSSEKWAGPTFFVYFCTAFGRKRALCDWNPHNPRQHERDGLCRQLRSGGGGLDLVSAPTFFCNGHLVRDKRVPSAERLNKTHAICQEYVSTTGCATANHIREAPSTIFVGNHFGRLLKGNISYDSQHRLDGSIPASA